MIVTVSWRPTDKAIVNDLCLTRFDNTERAEAYVESLPDDHTAYFIDASSSAEVEIALDSFRPNAVVLAELYNGFARNGEPTTQRFKNGREEAMRRTACRLWDRATAAPLWVSEPSTAALTRLENDADVLSNADCFYATTFRGPPKVYDTIRAKTLDEARKLAISMISDRPVMIYAVSGGRQVHVENVDPRRLQVDEEHTKQTEISQDAKAAADADRAERKAAKEAEKQAAKEAKAKERAERKAAKEAEKQAAKEAKEPRYTLGEPKQVKCTSNLGKVLAVIGPDGSTMDDIITETGFSPDKVVSVLRAGRGSHGVDHELSGHKNGREVDFAAAFVKVTPPVGYTYETMFAPDQEPKPQPQPQSVNGEQKPRLNKIVEAAKQGIIPQTPDFSANTHRSYRKKLAEIVALVEARDLEGLRKHHVHVSGPGSTSPIAMQKYRDRAIIALEAQNTTQNAAAE